MPTARRIFWLPALAILSAILALAACGGTDAPELPSTDSESVIAYLEEVDYQNNDEWSLFPVRQKCTQELILTVCC